MAGNAPHHPCILVMDLALHNAMAKGSVVFRGRNMSLIWVSGEIEADEEPAERLEDLSAAEGVQSLTHDPLQGHAEQDEPDVAVFGTGAGIGLKCQLVCLGQQLGAILSTFKELHVRRQSG